MDYVVLQRGEEIIKKPMAHLRLKKFLKDSSKPTISRTFHPGPVDGSIIGRVEILENEQMLARSERIFWDSVTDEHEAAARLTWVLSDALAMLGYDIDHGIAGGEAEQDALPQNQNKKAIDTALDKELK
jgi:hypothetical protein